MSKMAEGLPLWYDPKFAVFLNRWFANYDEARTSLEQEGGYLLPYKNHFFICESGMIRAMGLDPKDPDWDRIGHDAVRPADAAAMERIAFQRKKVIAGS